MKKPATLLALTASTALLSGCPNIQPSDLTSNLSSSSSSSKQIDVWVDKNGYQPDIQDKTNCSIQAKITAKQISAAQGAHKDILGMIGDKLGEVMEESSQLDSCMMSKGYVKIKTDPGQVFPQRPGTSIYPNSGVNPYVNGVNSHPTNIAPNTFQSGNPYSTGVTPNADPIGWRPTVDPYNDPNAARISQDMDECKQLVSQVFSSAKKGSSTEKKYKSAFNDCMKNRGHRVIR